MSISWLEVPTPGGDLAAMLEAERSLALHAQRVADESIELDRLARQVSADWVGETAETFAVRVASARIAIDGVSDTHRQAAQVIGTYGDEWVVARDACVKAHGDIEDAFSDFVRDGRARAQALASGIRAGIESLDDSLEDIPVFGGLLSKGTGVVTDGMGWLAEELIERLLSWNPTTPSPGLRPILSDEVIIATTGSIASSISSAAEWSIDRLLDGIDQVIDFVGGAIAGAVAALRAVGDALVDGIAAGLSYAKQAMDALLALGAQVAVTVATLVTATSRIVFEATFDAYVASMEFLISLGMGITQVLDFMADVNDTLSYAAILAIRAVFARQDRRMSEEEAKAADSRALRALADREYRRGVIARSDLAASAYHDTGAPDGWERVQNYPGTDGFFAAAFRNTETGEVVLAFRGSEPDFDIKDWRDDVINANNLPTAQARQAIDVSRSFAKDFQGSDLSLSGHSLGGSLASTASLATGIPASTFNAAGVGDSNYALASAQHQRDFGTGPSERQITNYRTSNDILTEGQDAMGLRPASGAQVQIQSTTDDGPEPYNPANPLGGVLDDLIDSGKGHSQGSFDWDSVGGRPR